MLLGIPGDNTYANMAEAQRIFWRTTVLPLVERITTALSNWLGHTDRADLHFEADTDSLEALSPERDALWARLEKTSFLTEDEKRAAIGYGPKPPASLAPKHNPYHDAVGRFTFAPDGEGSERPQLIQDRRRGGRNRDTQLEGQLADLANRAQRATDRVRELDPRWEPPQSVMSRDSENLQARLSHQEAVLRAAEARYAEITRDAIPGVNHSWGVNRLTKELYEQGYRLERPTRDPGVLLRNANGDEVRIMERPRNNQFGPAEKFSFGHYYRYRARNWPQEGAHVPVPDKD